MNPTSLFYLILSAIQVEPSVDLLMRTSKTPCPNHSQGKKTRAKTFKKSPGFSYRGYKSFH